MILGADATISTTTGSGYSLTLDKDPASFRLTSITHARDHCFAFNC